MNKTPMELLLDKFEEVKDLHFAVQILTLRCYVEDILIPMEHTILSQKKITNLTELK